MQRAIYTSINEHLQAKEFTIITGARQIGKTTLLKQLEQHLLKEKKAFIFLNLERKDVLDALNQSPEHVFKYRSLSEHQTLYVLLDEIQYLNDPSNFLKLLYDEYAPSLKIVATGSSAFYMDQQFNDSLAGRKKIFELKTLCFQEFLMFKKEEEVLQSFLLLKSGNIKTSLLINRLWIEIEEYLTFGGYPAVVLDPNKERKKERLQELRDSFLKRDVLEAGVKHQDKFYQLLRIIAQQSGQLLNMHELSNTLRLSHQNIENYIHILQTCFHIELLKPFHNNIRKELVKMPKVYFYDLGLRNCLLDSFQSLDARIDKGVLFENYIFRILSDRYPKEHIRFWRTSDQHEVDFVIEQSPLHGFSLEVKFSDTQIKPTKYKKFIEQYPNYPLQFTYWKDDTLWSLF